MLFSFYPLGTTCEWYYIDLSFSVGLFHWAQCPISWQMAGFPSFLWLNNPHIHILHLLYTFVCWWTLSLFPDLGYLMHCWWECKLVQSLWKTVWRLLKKKKKVKKKLLYDPAVPLLDIYSKEIKTGSQREIWVSMAIAALFIIYKIWKPAQVPISRCLV